jgi:hypothetical protein
MPHLRRAAVARLLPAALVVLSFYTQSAAQRGPTPESVLFRRLRGGVCTVYGASGRGSGFLVDSLGIILTNDHVIDPSFRIRVKFDDSTRLDAFLLAEDDKKDIAVIRVNPEAIRGYPALHIAPQPDSMLFEGERVIAIGSPLNQEKILTAGIVSKVEPTAVISDVNINHGSSGGPLLNMDGDVVGINTFMDLATDGGPGISGAIKITEAESVLTRGRAMGTATPPPSSRRLPVLSRTPFPLDWLRATVENKQFSSRPYEVSKLIHTKQFDIVIVTPVYDRWRNTRLSVHLGRSAERRERRGNADGGAAEVAQGMKEWMRYSGDEYAPLVTIEVTPRIGVTAESVVGNIVGTAAASALRVPYRLAYELEYKADFWTAEVLRNGDRVDDLAMFRAWVPAVFATANWDSGVFMADQARTGIIQLDPSVFSPDGYSLPRISLRIWSSERSSQPQEINLPPVTIQQVWDDFAGWRGAVDHGTR